MINGIHYKYQKGFMATIAVVLLSTGALEFSLIILNAVAFYSEAIMKKELRIQAKMNAISCLDTTALLTVKDYFLNGEVNISEFGCNAMVVNDYHGNVSLNVEAVLGSVMSKGEMTLRIDNNAVAIISKTIY